MIDTSTSMRIMANNFLESGYGSFEVSSILDGNYKSDLIDGKQRTKTMSFGGRFLIEAGVNDKVYIGGVTKTIPAADYDSVDVLITAINTVTTPVLAAYDSTTSKIYFYTGTFTLNITTTSQSAWETLGFTGGVDISVVGTNANADVARIHWPYEQIDIDFGYQASIGFVGMIGDLGQEFRIPEGATITFMANTVNSFASPPLSQTIPWYKTGAFKFIDDVADSAWRYVRIIIECPEGPFTPEIGYLYIGDYAKFEDKNIGTGFDQIFEDDSEISESSGGQVYGNDRTPYRVYSSLSVGLARPTHAAYLKSLYKLKQKTVPFFISLDPTSYLSDSFDEHLAFVRFPSSPRYKHIIRNIFELSFEFREAL